MIARGTDEASEERVPVTRRGAKFRVVLARHEERVLRQLDDLDQAVARKTREAQARVHQALQVSVVELEAVALVLAEDGDAREAASLLEREKLRRLVHVPGNTLDGVMVELHANIELPEEAQQAREVGADGIGLFRSEFLFLNRRDLPTEDEQYEAYRAAVLAMRGKPVTIRTLDVGADKALDEPQAAVSPNPALCQAMRMKNGP